MSLQEHEDSQKTEDNKGYNSEDDKVEPYLPPPPITGGVPGYWPSTIIPINEHQKEIELKKLENQDKQGERNYTE